MARRSARTRWWAVVVVAAALAFLVGACGSSSPPIVFGEMTTTSTAAPRTGTTDDTTVAGPTLGPWVDVTGNLAGMTSECGNLSYMAGHPATSQVIASVAAQGLWTLGLEGDQWSKLGEGSPTQVVNRANAIVFDPAAPERFWEAGSYSRPGTPGVVRTTNGGATFEGLGGLSHIDGLSVDLTDPERRTILAGGHETAELQLSTDGGASFRNVAPEVPRDVYTTQPLVINADVFLLGTANGPGVDGAAIYRSTDRGATWAVVQSGGVAGLPLVASDRSIYWPLQDGGMVRSADEGQTWSKVTRSGTLSSYNVVELSDGRLASLTSRYAAASSDQGRTWRPLGSALPTTFTKGVAYSAARNALFVYGWDCNEQVPAGAVQRLDLPPPA